MRRILLAAPVTIDLLEFEREALIDEILTRTRLIFASYDPARVSFGIVDRSDPRTTISGDVSRPFTVSTNAADPSSIDISGGTVVFSTGEIVSLETGAERVVITGGIGSQSVVYLEFSELEKGTRLTRWDTLASTYVDFLDSDLGYFKITPRTNYDSLTITEKDMTIPIAVVSVQEVISGVGGATTPTLVIDHTSTALATNRPWYSPVDIEHRSYLGSGVASTTNPHAISLNDVSASADQTLFQVHLDHGMIVSKDKTLAKVPGKLCVEEILAAGILTDVGGTVTGISNSFYFYTANFPTLVIRATDLKDKLFDYAPVHVARTNLVFFLPSDEYIAGSDIEVTYVTTDAAEPPVDVPLTSLTVKQIGFRETVIADGLVVNSITDPELSFSDAGPIPQKFIAYLDSSGAMKHYPQGCANYVKLSDIGTALQPFNQNLIGLAPVKIALQGALPSATLSVQIQITGVDQYGTTITETVEFTRPSWVDNAVETCSEEPNQFITTVNSFTSLLNYMVIGPVVDAGLAAAIAIYGDITPELTPEIADILPVAEVMWDGLKICSLEDIRPINTHLELPRVTKFAGASVASSEGTLVYMAGTLFNFWLEDFDQPKFITNKWSDTSTPGGDPPPFDTSMRKIVDGLDLSDLYVSKPIAVRPQVASVALVALRFIPIEPDRNFKIYARYFDGRDSWSPWLGSGSMMMPPYTVWLDAAGAVTPLVKWQMAVSGQCKGMTVAFVVDVPAGVPGSGAPAGASPFVYDIGVWDNGAFS